MGGCLFYFFEKIRLDTLCESSARQTFHMKCQALFSRNTTKKISSATVVFGAVRAKPIRPRVRMPFEVVIKFGLRENGLYPRAVTLTCD